MKKKLFAFFLSLCFFASTAQVHTGAVAAYGVRKIIPAYTGKALQVRRTCDNATLDIGFNSCGLLDTSALKTFVIASNPLSAITATSTAAFSMRRLSCAYAGKCLQVRRSSDNTTQDVGFTANGDLDTASLKTFVGSSNGFVSAWYDQSGNARNATQATAASQPRIVNAGVIDRQNNLPAIYFNGSNGLFTAGFTAFATAACFNEVTHINTNTTYNAVLNKCNVNFPAPLDFYNGTIVIGDGGSGTYNFFSPGITFNATQPLGIWTYQAASSGSVSAYYNQSSVLAPAAVTYFGDPGNPLTIGTRNDLLTTLNGWVSEAITFGTLPSATDRAFVEWSQSAYYGISGPTLGSLPAAAASASVTVWYDQSGNGKDAVQATVANQPRIVNAGVLDKNGSYPAISFAGNPQNLVAPLSATAYPVSLSLLANTFGNNANGAFVKYGGIVNDGTAGIGIGIGSSGTNFDNSGNTVIGLKEWVIWCPSSGSTTYPSTPFTSTTIQQSGTGGLSTYLNGANVPLSNSTSAVGGSITGNLYIGGYTNTFTRYAVVKESEVAVFGSALSATRRTLVETNQSAFYGVTTSNAKYTAPATNSYNYYVNGIGRESATDSVANTTATAGMGAMCGQTATDFLKDNGDYITFGMGCKVSNVSTASLPATVTQSWANDWYVKKTDISSNNGNLKLYFDYSDYGVSGVPGTASNYVLLYRSAASGTYSIVSSTTVSISGDRVYFALDASNLTTNYYYTIGTKDENASPLPVELLNFSATPNGNKVDLAWETVTETNNSFFTVEKSKDGKKFSKVIDVPGAGNSTNYMNYGESDYQPYEGVSYYRLKQTDKNGMVTVFPMVSVKFGKQRSITVYPNPAQKLKDITIEVQGYKNEEITVVLRDIQGREFFSKLIMADSDDKLYLFDASYTLPPGTYIVTASSNDKIFNCKLVIN